jgi:hypothetical protein
MTEDVVKRAKTPVYKIAKKDSSRNSNERIEADQLIVGQGIGLPASYSSVHGAMTKDVAAIRALHSTTAKMANLFIERVGEKNLGRRFTVTDIYEGERFSFVDDQGITRIVPFYLDGLLVTSLTPSKPSSSCMHIPKEPVSDWTPAEQEVIDLFLRKLKLFECNTVVSLDGCVARVKIEWDTAAIVLRR